MVLEVLRHRFACIQTRFDLRMCDVTTNDDGAVQAQTRSDRVFRQDSTYIFHRLVEVDTYGIAFACLTQFLGNERSRVVIQLLNPYTVFVDLTFDVSVSRAAYAQANRAACTVTRQTNNTYVVRHVLSAELCTEADLVRLLQELLLQLHIAESTTSLIARRRQGVVIMGRSELHGQQVLLCRSTADDDSNVVRRTSSRSEAFHLLHKERNERTGVLDTRLGLLIEIGLVRRTATLGHAKETVLVAPGSLQVNLCREVTFGVHLVVHIQRRVLRIAQIALGIGVIHTTAQCLFIGETCPYFLSLLSVNNCRTGILAEW